MYKFKFDTWDIELSEPTEEALEKFLADPMLSVFLDDKIKDAIRKQLEPELARARLEMKNETTDY
jgi:hypothetical protein